MSILVELWMHPSICVNMLSYLMICSILRVDPTLCTSPPSCRRGQYDQWSRRLMLGVGRCFQAHSFADLSNHCATFLFTHLLPTVSQALLQLSRQSRTLTRLHFKWLMRLRIPLGSDFDLRCTPQFVVIHTCWCRLSEVTMSHCSIRCPKFSVMRF